MHDRFAVWFLVKRDPNHIDLTLDAEFTGGKGKGTAPLPRPGFGGQTFDTFSFVVVGLGYSTIWFVGADRGNTFIFKENFGFCIEGFFQAVALTQWGRPPDFQDIKDFLGNINEPLGGHLLFKQAHGKNCG